MIISIIQEKYLNIKLMYLYKQNIYFFIVALLLILNYLYYQTPFGFYSPIIYTIILYIPALIFVIMLWKSKNRNTLIINVVLLLLAWSFLGVISINGKARFSSIEDTNCGANIKTGYIGKGIGSYNEALLIKSDNGLYYTLHDISSDRSSNGVQNFSQNYGFRYNRKNFYKEGDFEKYRDCLPNVSKICPNYFWISISTDGDGCKDL
jgi:hypothetical protein